MAQSREERDRGHQKDKRRQSQPGVAKYPSLPGMVVHGR
jgi:hypothetical protein